MAGFAVARSDDGDGAAAHRVAPAIKAQVVVLLRWTVAAVAVLPEDRLHVADEINPGGRLREECSARGGHHERGGCEPSLQHARILHGQLSGRRTPSGNPYRR